MVAIAHKIYPTDILWCGFTPFFLSCLTGCALTLPMALEGITPTTEIAKKDMTAPRLTLTLHPDGLGWQALVTQQVTATVVTTGRERRRYRAFDFSGRNSKGSQDNYDDFCAIAMTFTPLFAPFDIEHPPYWNKWDRLSNTCGRSAEVLSSTKDISVGVMRRHKEHSVEAVTTGHLSLGWHSDSREPLQILIPLDENVKEPGVPVRLRWLGELMRRKGLEPGRERNGRVELQLLQHGAVVARAELSVTARDIAASLRDDHAVSVPADRWPVPLILRIQEDSASLDSVDRRHLLAYTAQTLTKLSIPLVVRGPDLDELRTGLAQFHQQAFDEILVPSAAHMRGATSLLHIDVHRPYAQSKVLSLRVIDIASGEILAQITTGGHESQWKFLVTSTLTQLDTILQPVLARPKVTPARDSP